MDLIESSIRPSLFYKNNNRTEPRNFNEINDWLEHPNIPLTYKHLATLIGLIILLVSLWKIRFNCKIPVEILENMRNLK